MTIVFTFTLQFWYIASTVNKSIVGNHIAWILAFYFSLFKPKLFVWEMCYACFFFARKNSNHPFRYHKWFFLYSCKARSFLFPNNCVFNLYSVSVNGEFILRHWTHSCRHHWKLHHLPFWNLIYCNLYYNLFISSRNWSQHSLLFGWFASQNVISVVEFPSICHK